MRKLILSGLFAALIVPSAWAGDDWVPPVTDSLVQKECGSCHMAFQPAFLPARSWAKMMDGLADHFGENVQLPADKAAAIRANLIANAGDVAGQGGHSRKALRHLDPAAVPLRITETPGFLRKHHFADRVWKDPKVVTKSNCPACHTGAERGWYEDD